jgi:hypothetical protein
MYRILVSKSEGKRQLRRPRHRWEDSMRMDLTEVGWEDVIYIHLSQVRDHGGLL